MDGLRFIVQDRWYRSSIASSHHYSIIALLKPQFNWYHFVTELNDNSVVSKALQKRPTKDTKGCYWVTLKSVIVLVADGRAISWHSGCGKFPAVVCKPLRLCSRTGSCHSARHRFTKTFFTCGEKGGKKQEQYREPGSTDWPRLRQFEKKNITYLVKNPL